MPSLRDCLQQKAASPQQYMLLHSKKQRTKDSRKNSSPSQQRKSLNHPRAPEQEVRGRGRGCQVGKLEPPATDQSGGRQIAQVEEERASRGGIPEASIPPGSKGAVTHIPRNPYKETPRETRSPSQRRKPKDLPPEDGQEEEKSSVQGSGSARGAEPGGTRERKSKSTPCNKTKDRGDMAGKGRQRSETAAPGNSGSSAKRISEGRKHQRASKYEDKEGPEAEEKEDSLR